MVFTSRFRVIRLLRFLSASKLLLGLVTNNYIREVSRIVVKPLFLPGLVVSTQSLTLLLRAFAQIATRFSEIFIIGLTNSKLCGSVALRD